MITKRIKSRLRGLIIGLLKILIRILNLDILDFAHSEIGAGNFGNEETTGEKYLIEDVLGKYFPLRKKLIFFDVGANIGKYSQLLRRSFKDASIFSFEPNPRAYDVLKKISKKENIIAENKGLGEKIHSKQILYSYRNLNNTQLGTTNREILKNYEINEEIEEIEFFSETIDNYCSIKKIEEIDFLKIDTEGSELSVLKGMKRLLKKNKVKIIQFEFNEPNIGNRIFLKDFYNTLINYDFYRLKNGALIPLGKYNAKNEIFRYQNILAINKCFS